jgi:FkbM family methyltransferase
MFFDIGANTGQWSLANRCRCEKIIAVEASPITFEKLVANVKEQPNILPLNYAVCKNNGKDVVFYEAESSTLSTLNKQWLTNEASRFYNTGYREIVCKSIHLDDLISAYGVPTLIKVDVEGGESECLHSLTQKVDMLCFEWAAEMNDITFQCIDHLISLGFTKFHIQITDDYTYRPQEDGFQEASVVKALLQQAIPKHHWGMIWCR